MPYDLHTNFAYGTVSNAPGTAGLSIILQSGQGTLFPAGSFNATVWPASVAPGKSNAEIVRCSSRTADTLTIARAQEGSTAVNITAGYQIIAAVTAKTLTDMETSTAAAVSIADAMSGGTLDIANINVQGALTLAEMPTIGGLPFGSAVLNDGNDFDAIGAAAMAIANYQGTAQARTGALSGPSPVAGANSSEYVTAAWARTTISAMIAAALGTAPINTGVPVISGNPVVVGSPLTVTPGNWTGAAPTLAYQWQKSANLDLSAASNCTGAGAATNTYTPAVGDDLVRLFCAVTATVGANNATATSLPVKAAPNNTIVPALNGTPKQGLDLTLGNGTFTGLDLTYTYQFYRKLAAGSVQVQAPSTDNTYTCVAADVGFTIYGRTIATNSEGLDTGDSVLSGVVQAPTGVTAPVNTTPPVITGTPLTAGTVLACDNGQWTQTPTSYTRQWYSGGTTAAFMIPGATGPTYQLQGTDITDTVYCTVTATNAAGSGTIQVATAGTIAAGAGLAPANTALPVLSGQFVVGQMLTTTQGAWSNTPLKYNMGWRRIAPAAAQGTPGTPIAGATGLTYQLTTADVGYQIYTAIEAVNNAGAVSAYAARGGGASGVQSQGGGSNAGTLLWAPTYKIGQVPIEGNNAEWVSLGSNYIGTDVSCVADPLGSGTPVYKYSVPDSHRPSTNKPRADMCSGYGIAEGDNVFLSISVYVPSGQGLPNFTGGGSSYWLLGEVKDTIGNSPWTSFSVQYITSFGGVTYNSLCYIFHATGQTTPPLAVFGKVDNAWHNLILSGIWSRYAGTGYQDAWWDGNRVITQMACKTLGATPTQVGSGPQPFDQLSYRPAGVYAGTLINYFGKPKIGRGTDPNNPPDCVLPDSGKINGP